MSKKTKTLKGLDSLANLDFSAEEVAVGKDPVQVAVEFLAADPVFPVVLKATEKITEAGHVQAEIDRLEGEKTHKSKTLADLAIKTAEAGMFLREKAEAIRKGILNSPGITEARNAWMGRFAAKLDQAVEVGMQADSLAVRRREELAKMVAEIEKIRSAKEWDELRIADNREKFEQLTKEAGDLLASIA